MKKYDSILLLSILFFINACVHIEKESDMHEYFVGYSYGMGGHWYLITAPSKKIIRNKYPNVKIYDEVPDWLGKDSETLQYIRDEESFNIDNVPELDDKLLRKAGPQK